MPPFSKFFMLCLTLLHSLMSAFYSIKHYKRHNIHYTSPLFFMSIMVHFPLFFYNHNARTTKEQNRTDQNLHHIHTHEYPFYCFLWFCRIFCTCVRCRISIEAEDFIASPLIKCCSSIHEIDIQQGTTSI